MLLYGFNSKAGNMSTGQQENPVYIFVVMQPNKGYEILKKSAATLPNVEELKDKQTPLWLLRESRVHGMLTLDYIVWDKVKLEWKSNSSRIALTELGWIKANTLDKAQTANVQKVTAESARNHVESLKTYINNLHPEENPTSTFLLENRLNPTREQQTRTNIYSVYRDPNVHSRSRAHSPNENVPTSSFQNNNNNNNSINNNNMPSTLTGQKRAKEGIEVMLTPGMAQAIICELTKKSFEDPVVMRENRTITDSKGNETHLILGQSYEKSALLALGVTQGFYSNFNLKKIIDRLGANDVDKLKTMQDRMYDPILLDTIEDPIIISSGHSYSAATIDELIKDSVRTRTPLRCPVTRENFSALDITPNRNLARFMAAWPEFKDEFIAKTQGVKPAAGPDDEDESEKREIKKLKK